MATMAELKGQFVVTELERRLSEDQDGAERNKLKAFLAGWQSELTTQRNAGLPSEQFAQVEKVLASVRVAQQAIQRTWNQNH